MSAQQEYSQNSYNKMGMFTFISSMVVSIAVLIYVSFLSGGIDLKEVTDAKAGVKAPVSSGPANSEVPATAAAPDMPAAQAPETKP
jgi:hypothetical protein